MSVVISQTVFITRRYAISCMHRLYSPDLSAEENVKIYGKCCNVHGHDYRIEVTVRGEVDVSGLCCDRDYMDDEVRGKFICRFDKTDLNTHFKSTTGEDLARGFYEILKRDLAPLCIVRVRLQETPKNFFVYGEPAAFPEKNLNF
jgi:6-pyruvoyltetrahydropterin/6-carboxytetrahydropterin synthase